MGGALCDYESDLDFYLTNYGANELFRNDSARFAAIRVQSCVDDPR